MEGKKSSLLTVWLRGVEISKLIGDFVLIFNAMKLAGDIFLEFKDFSNALKSFQSLKRFCDEKKRYKEKILCYEQIGLCYRLLEDHNQAIKFFRK